MKKIFSLLLVLSALLAHAEDKKQLSKACKRPQIVFSTAQEGRTLVTSTNNLKGPFDIQARLGRADGTLTELEDFQRAQVQEFTAAEKDSLNSSIDRLLCHVHELGIKLPLPETITFVKTTQVEEGGAAAYTLGDAIFLNTRTISAPPAWREMLVAHELFHMLTRSNADFRQKMYGVIGFTVLPTGNINFAEDVWARRITNPDVERHDSYVMLDFEGKQTPHVMLLMANRDYQGGSFFEYLQTSLILLDQNFMPQRDADGKTIVRVIEDVPEFWQRVGKNTGYVIDPEECMADNFAFAVTGYCGTTPYPNPEIFEAIISRLQ